MRKHFIRSLAHRQTAGGHRHFPNRARSLPGLSRTYAQICGCQRAAESYAKLLSQWQQADANRPEARGAREFVGQTAQR